MSAWIDFKQLRARLDFSAVIQHYGVSLKGNRIQHYGFCPLPTHPTHAGKRKSPSFSANLPRGIWQCFGCGAKGNVLDFAVRMEGKDPANRHDVRDVAFQLQDQFGVNTVAHVSQERAGGSTAKAASANESNEPAPVINTSLDFRLQNLDPEHPYLAARGFAPETIKHFGLGYCSRGVLKGRIAIPVHNREGWLVGYAGRLVDDNVIDEENPKYRFPRPCERDGVRHEFRKSLLLYNANTIREPVEDLVVVEGFPSVWWLWQCGVKPVVAVMGSSCSDEQAAMIIDLVTPAGRVWVLGDGDDAGIRCALTILAPVSQSRLVRYVPLDQGKQPTDLPPEELARFFSIVQ